MSEPEQQLKKEKTQWFWCLADGKTVKQVTLDKAQQLVTQTLKDTVKHTLVRLYKGDLHIIGPAYISRHQMMQLIPILTEVCFP